MEGMTENFRMKYSPSDKRKLGDIAKATSENESEVVRRLIRHASDRLMTTLLNDYIVGEKVSMGTFDLDSILDESEHKEITWALMRFAMHYVAAQRKDDFMREVLEVVFASDPAKLERSKKVFDAYMRTFHLVDEAQEGGDDTQEGFPYTEEDLQAIRKSFAENVAKEHEDAQEQERIQSILRREKNKQARTKKGARNGR